MTNTLADSGDIIEGVEDEYCEDQPEVADLTATEDATESPMEFHVQMNGYTLRDFDRLVIEAAARKLLERSSSPLAKDIEAKCIALTTEKILAALEPVTAEIFEQPILPKSSFGPTKGETAPVTMREFVGLCGREFLTRRVNNVGKPTTDPYSRSQSMLEYLVSQHLDKRFKDEIAKASTGLITEFRERLKAKTDALVAEERARIREAFESRTK